MFSVASMYIEEEQSSLLSKELDERELVLATCGTSFTGSNLNQMLSVAADHSCTAIRRDFGMFFFYTNLF